MVGLDDFAAHEVSSKAVTVIHSPSGQTFKFESVNGLCTFGAPLMSGSPSQHPPWLMAWFARQIAHQAAKSNGSLPVDVPHETLADPLEAV